MKNLMEKVAVGGILAAVFAVVLVIAGIVMAAGGLVLGPFIGIGQGLVAVANSNADLKVWYDNGAHLDLPGDCMGTTNDPFGNLLENSCQAGAKEGIEFWNEMMSYRATRLALMVLVPGVLFAFLANLLAGLIINRSNAAYRGSQ
jgi:hypothetical protein